MKTTHIVEGHSAAGSLMQALRLAGREDGLLVFLDDLSCGPVASMDPVERNAWWQEQMDWPEIDEHLRSFWGEVDATEGRLVVWFGRHSARELAFRMAWAWRMIGRPYHVIDVTGLRIPVRWGDGRDGVIEAAQAVASIPANGLVPLFSSETAATADEDAVHQREWTRLMAENAPFRIVTSAGLASAPLDYFDQLILAQASSAWKKMGRILGEALGASWEPYQQVSGSTLRDRIMALIEKGDLVADGDPEDIWTCKVRLAGSCGGTG
jgi:hypothetical protein